MSDPRPLVTFALFAYNQERYIAEAVQGALAQDYEPLEIILSDDCSTDRTFEVIQDVVESYCGPHLVRTNKNATNLGVAAHVDFVMKKVKSDFVVVAAGDDISEPHRTSEMVGAWLTSGRQALSIHSSATEIDECGKPTGRIRKGQSSRMLNNLKVYALKNVGVLGAAHAWDMRIINSFPPMLSSVVNEDAVLPARAALLGTVLFINKPLVRYRRGIGISSEALRNRAVGTYRLTPELLKPPYYCLLQKYRDYKHVERGKQYGGLFAKARARQLCTMRFRDGKLSRKRIIYFVRRCTLRFLWELGKRNFPCIVALKHRIQFTFLESAFRALKNVRTGL